MDRRIVHFACSSALIPLSPYLHTSFPIPPNPFLSPTGLIRVQGPAQNESHPSGETITLHCMLEGAGQETEYVWTRESGDDLPQHSLISGGEFDFYIGYCSMTAGTYQQQRVSLCSAVRKDCLLSSAQKSLQKDIIMHTVYYGMWLSHCLYMYVHGSIHLECNQSSLKIVSR